MDLDAKDRSNARDSAYISSAEIDNVSRGSKDSDKMLRYMKGFMTFAGLYYRPLKSCPSFPLDLIFCLFTLLLMIGEFCRVSILYEATQPFSVKILRLLSHICIAKDLIIIVLFLCSITPKLRQFSSKYHTYCLNRLSYNDSKPIISMNLKTTIFLSYLFLFLIRFFINITPSIWPELVDNYSKPYFTNPDPTITRIVGVACSAFFVYYHFIDTTAYVFLLVICKVISVEFTIVTSQLKLFLKEENSDMEEELKDHRKRYLELCRLVATLDNAVGPLILTLCLFDMLTIVFHVTGFLDVNIVGMSSLWFRVITFLSALDRTIHLGSLIYAGVNLNAKALAVKPLLLDIDLNSSTRAFQEALLFIQKVSHDHIGLSAYGLFNINKSFIVTAVSIGLSYSIILLRFGIIMGYETFMGDENAVAGPTTDALVTTTTLSL